MSSQAKDTIYIDIDDEITSIIDKVNQSPHKIVALVLPKRAVVLQSIVNMKLLKRAAEQASKNIVLITSEHGLLPLAGSVGLHVAKSLQSKPQIPAPPEDTAQTEEIVEDEKDVKIDPRATIGSLALGTEEEGPIEVEPVEDASLGASEDTGEKADKKLKVPNFNTFRTRLFLGIAALLLLVMGWVWAFLIAPRAVITIKTDTENFSSTLNFTADPAAPTLDLENSIVPAVKKEVTKVQTGKAPATGQKDMGTKASGTVALKNCTKTDSSITVPAGTGVSTNNLTYITQSAVTLPASSFSGGGSCTTSSKDVAITAQNPGDQYNISAGRTFAVSGYSSISGTNEAAIAGGTTKIVKVVSDADVEAAKQQFAAGSGDIKEELSTGLTSSGLFALAETFESIDPAVVATPKVGEEATEVSVVATTTYAMLGVKEDDLQKLIEPGINDQIDTAKQKIIDYGLSEGVLRVVEKKDDTKKIEAQTVVAVGPQIDIEALKKEILGKKRGDIERLVGSQPGVKEVTVQFKPVWVYSTPKSAKKITINIE